ncbi:MULTISPECIES: purine-cytosine permease family protein [Pontibacillus]|uniref:Cytosine permease n=1 Tax=Pontibacillus chungwhensis TaxID=265426 RepID=A0ABY8UUS0_9BACI|nr:MULTISPECIES: cytosine permease [Pontibacillus]MCD5323858.1 cytosine permease [Pontibacillus sp. HN14]WIF97219.1 cytosine permease [Pontibacillus chungwhensis]
MNQAATSAKQSFVEKIGLDAVPVSERTTPWYQYAIIQIAISANAGNFLIPALAVMKGNLSFLAAVIATSIGAIAGFIFVSLLSYPGSLYGIPSQYAIRTMLGGKGARYISSPIRSLTSLYWFSVQTIGGTYVLQQLIVRMTGKEYPFLMFSLPLSIIMVILAIVGFGAVKKATSYFLPLLLVGEGVMVYLYFTTNQASSSLVTLSPHEGHGSLSMMIFFASLAFVQYVSGVSASADMTRYAKSPKQGALGLWIGNSIGFLITATIGCSSAVLFNELNPYVSASNATSSPLLLGIITLTAMISMVSINISNAYTGGYSLLNTFSRLSRITSAVIFGLLGVALSSFPTLVSEAEQFISILGGLIIPISAVIVVDFLVIKKGVLSPQSLQTIQKEQRFLKLPFLFVVFGSILYFLLPDSFSPGFITFVVVGIGYGIIASIRNPHPEFV